MNDIIVIDCSALCYASAFSLVGMEDDDIETGIIFGFLRQLRMLSQKFGTNDLVFTWDSKQSKRKEFFPEYKMKRGKKKKEDPEIAKIFASTYEQIKKLKEHVLPSIGFINSFEQNGLEADDLMADIVQGYDNCVIVTNDEDLFQMLDYCNIWLPGKKKLITASSFEMEFGIQPSKWDDVKAFGGCKADEVPGIPIPNNDNTGWSKRGVGQGTAIKYVKNELPSHYKALKAIESDHGMNVYFRNIKLVHLPHTETKTILLNDFVKLNAKGFWDICNEYNFRSFSRGTELVKWNLWLEGRL